MKNNCRVVLLRRGHWLFIYILQENLLHSELLENVRGNFEGIRTAGLADFWSLQRSRLAGIPGANWLSSK